MCRFCLEPHISSLLLSKSQEDSEELDQDIRVSMTTTKDFIPSTKIRALTACLKEQQEKNRAAQKHLALKNSGAKHEPPVKSVVFSQFTGFLDLVEVALRAEGITYERLDGSMSHIKRTEAIDRFKRSNSISVFLISLKAGGIGLNLTEASCVYLLDPWWNVSYFTSHIYSKKKKQ